MCRLFGQISLKSSTAKDLLIDSKYSLLKQSTIKPGHEQKDGWGIGYYFGNSGHPKLLVSKSPHPIFEEKKRLDRLAAQAKSNIVIAHIRYASNPKAIPKKQLISQENSQPFYYRNLAFAHNGTIEIPDEVFSFLGHYKQFVRGKNDSEIYFWQLIKFMDAYGSIPKALMACVEETWGIWKGCRSRYPKKKKPYTGLNALVSDGKNLYAMCHYPSKNCSLCNPKRPWGNMCFTRREGQVIISSEPMDQGHWESFKDPEIMVAEPQKDYIKISRTRFQIAC